MWSQFRLRGLRVWGARYLAAILAVSLALFLTTFLWNQIRPSTALLFAAVMLSAWYGGMGPGLLASLFAAVAAEYLFMEPTHHIDLRDAVRLAVFLLSAVLISWMNAERHAANASLRAARVTLVSQVEQRTAELKATNEQLRDEIREHERAQKRVLDFQNQLRAMHAELALVEERERRRIAVDLHDRIGQSLVMAQFKIREIHALTSDADTSALISDATEILNQTVRDTRSLMFELSPPVLYDLGLSAALGWLTQNLSRQHGLVIELKDNNLPVGLSQARRVILFRTVRELLMNVIKHARTDRALVSVRMDHGRIRIEVTDRGAGFEVSRGRPGQADGEHFGLLSVTEQIQSIGGQLKVESSVGNGTNVVLVCPVDSGPPGGSESLHGDKNSPRG